MFTNREFCRYMQGQPLTPEQGAEAVARLRAVLSTLDGASKYLERKVTGREKMREAVNYIAEEIADFAREDLLEYADNCVDHDTAANFCLDNALLADKETFTRDELLQFAEYVLERAADAVREGIKGNYKDAGEIASLTDYVREVENSFDDLDGEEFDPVDAARDTGAPLLFTA